MYRVESTILVEAEICSMFLGHGML